MANDRVRIEVGIEGELGASAGVLGLLFLEDRKFRQRTVDLVGADELTFRDNVV